MGAISHLILQPLLFVACPSMPPTFVPGPASVLRRILTKAGRSLRIRVAAATFILLVNTRPGTRSFMQTSHLLATETLGDPIYCLQESGNEVQGHDKTLARSYSYYVEERGLIVTGFLSQCSTIRTVIQWSPLQPTEPFHMARLLCAPFFLDLMVSLSSFHCYISRITAINMNL